MHIIQGSFRTHLRKVARINSSLDQKLSAITALLSSILKHDPTLRIRYVAGRVTSDGPEYINQNLTKLKTFTDEVEKKYGQYVFSAEDVFPNETFWKQNITTKKLKYVYVEFWQKLFKSGITDMHMSPG